MLRDEQNAEVVAQKRILESAERDCDENELACRRGARESHPVSATERGAEQSAPCLHERKTQRERQRELTEFRDH